ncbi:MAG: hypothetical protein AAGJ97_09880 [Planctomycetota bacterium]
MRLTIAALCLVAAKVCCLLLLAGVWALCGGFGPVDLVVAPLAAAMLFWCLWASLTGAWHCLTPGKDTAAVVDWALWKFVTAMLAMLSAMIVVGWFR